MQRNASEVAALAPFDPMLTPSGSRQVRRQWAGLSAHTDDPIPEYIVQDPVINPSVGDLGVFKGAGTQLVIVSGTWDTMHPAVLEFVGQAEKKGVRTVYIEGESQVHVFPMMRRFVKEAEIAAQAIVQAVRAYSSV